MDQVKFRHYSTVLLIILLGLFVISFLFPTGQVHLMGGGEYFDDGPAFITFKLDRDYNYLTVPPRVLDYKNTFNYLLIKQHPQEQDNVMFPRYSYPSGRDTVYYWLIDKRQKKLIGPMLYSEMKQTLEEQNLGRMIDRLD